MSDIYQEWRELREKNRDILKTINREQVDRIKNLNEKLDKAMADYRALWVENRDLKSQLAGAKAQCENTVENRRRISELSQEVIDLREQQKVDLAVKKDLDEKLKKAAADYKALLIEHEAFGKNAAKSYAKLANERNNLAETVSKMQSKIAKQAAEIKRLTEENERLKAQKANVACAMEMWNKYEEETETLKKALDLAAKDADANFERGKIKGMEEIWDELKDCYSGRPTGENEKIFGYCTVGEIVGFLSPTWFMNKAEEYHKQEEQQVKDIQLGDEVEVIDDSGFSNLAIVIGLYPKSRSFEAIRLKFTSCFDELDIQDGTVKKTGRHFDSIPLDYFK